MRIVAASSTNFRLFRVKPKSHARSRRLKQGEPTFKRTPRAFEKQRTAKSPDSTQAVSSLYPTAQLSLTGLGSALKIAKFLGR
jgi:hypothetical protein